MNRRGEVENAADLARMLVPVYTVVYSVYCLLTTVVCGKADKALFGSHVTLTRQSLHTLENDILILIVTSVCSV